MEMKDISPTGGPVVCAVGNSYVICIPVSREVLIKAEIGGRNYYCHSNGVRISNAWVQKITVPMKILDKAKKYKIIYEVVNERFPYSCDKQPAESVEYSFRPIEKDKDINIYHLSDVHGLEKAAIGAGSYFGNKLDMLILNGDIASSSNSPDDILLTYRIAYAVTQGSVPCVISRGNHDLRGRYAEKLTEFLPTDNGRSYFSVRLGPVWILVLDCGEDKEDWHKEYSGTVAFHQFRESECSFIDNIIENRKNEYEADGVKYRFVLCHIPFCQKNTEECKGERPFNIENEIYTYWCERIKAEICPDLSIFGHLHVTEICPPGSEFDDRGLGGNIIIGGRPIDRKGLCDNVIGTALTVEEDGFFARITDKKGIAEKEKKIVFRQHRGA